MRSISYKRGSEKLMIFFTIRTQTGFVFISLQRSGNVRAGIFGISEINSGIKKGDISVIELIGGLWTMSIGDLIDTIFISFAKSDCATHCLFHVQRFWSNILMM